MKKYLNFSRFVRSFSLSCLALGLALFSTSCESTYPPGGYQTSRPPSVYRSGVGYQNYGSPRYPYGYNQQVHRSHSAFGHGSHGSHGGNHNSHASHNSHSSHNSHQAKPQVAHKPAPAPQKKASSPPPKKKSSSQPATGRGRGPAPTQTIQRHPNGEVIRTGRGRVDPG